MKLDGCVELGGGAELERVLELNGRMELELETGMIAELKNELCAGGVNVEDDGAAELLVGTEELDGTIDELAGAELGPDGTGVVVVLVVAAFGTICR